MSLKKLTRVSILAFALFSTSLTYAIDETAELRNPTTIDMETPPSDSTSGFFSTSLDKIATTAKELLGTKYKFGGTSPESGFDCSGFVRYVFKEANIQLPRSSYEMRKMGKPVDLKSLEVGDLLFFKINTSHVGIYIGNGKFIHSPTTGRSVTIESLADSIYNKRLLGARRILSDVTY